MYIYYIFVGVCANKGLYIYGVVCANKGMHWICGVAVWKGLGPWRPACGRAPCACVCVCVCVRVYVCMCMHVGALPCITHPHPYHHPISQSP